MILSCLMRKLRILLMNETITYRLKKEPKAPWRKHYGNISHYLEYPDATLYEVICKTAERYPNNHAYEFMGRAASYSEMMLKIEDCAKGLKTIGIKENDVVTICLPNTPQAIIAFYALNKIGAIPSMIHPLSAAKEIEFFLEVSKSVVSITLDAFYGKFAEAMEKFPQKKLIVTSIADGLGMIKGTAFKFTKGRKIKKLPKKPEILYWKEMIKSGSGYYLETKASKKSEDVAAILYSGGTTGYTKGIALTNGNFNALALTVIAFADCLEPGGKMLNIMPMFHGFGLGICTHGSLSYGLQCVLIPQFNNQTYGKIINQYKPNYIAGVPTLFEAMLTTPALKDADLSFLKGVFCGGDSLTFELKKKVDAFLKERGCNEQIREGYGLTECVTGTCVTLRHIAKEGSIGVPTPDHYYKICQVGTSKEVPYGEVGEICIVGPTNMIGYINYEEENKQVLQKHADGNVWLHTGDLGRMDEEGFIYFNQRLKRMIISSGYSIYPSQLENIIEAHPAVLSSCVIGIDDPYKVQRVKAFIVLRAEYAAMYHVDTVEKEIKEYCRKNIAKYAMPSMFEFRGDLPKTLVGKIAYTVLEEEERAKASTEKN